MSAKDLRKKLRGGLLLPKTTAFSKTGPTLLITDYPRRFLPKRLVYKRYNL
jgi:hypothetical protein